jgi:EmrB/QacA subfamily drug resistance transporter
MATVALKSKEGFWIMTSTILASAMAFIDGTALNVVLPSLQENLQATGADLFWVLNAYLLMLASLILIGGSLGDKFGRKKVLMIGIIIFILGSAACGFSPSVSWLIIFRILQGIGGAFMIPGSLSLISSSIDEKEKGKAIGTWSAFTTIVTIGGPILGGALGDAGLWRYIFFINIPFGIIAILILFSFVKESLNPDKSSSLDLLGSVAIASSLALLTFGFLKIPALGFQHWQVYLSLLLGIVLMFLFIKIEKKVKAPMMPLTLFLNPTFSGANLLTFFLYAGLGAGMLFLSLNLVQVQGYSQLQSGLTFLPFTILMVLLTRFSGSMADKYGPRWFLIVGPATAGIGLLLLSFIRQTAGPSAYWSTFFPGIVVFGLGMSITVSPLTTAVMGAVDDKFSGLASGVNNAMTRIASVFANAIFGAIAVLLFSTALTLQIQKVPVKDKIKQEIIKQSVNFGNAKIPANLSTADQTVIRNSYHNSFIYAYSIIMKICAGLAFIAAIMTMIFIKKAILTDLKK